MNARESAENVLELLFWSLERLSHPTIHKLYSKVIALCDALDAGPGVGGLSVLRRRQVLVNQRSAWLEAVSADPLLPFGLCPDDYQGKRAFEVRKATYDRMVNR